LHCENANDMINNAELNVRVDIWGYWEWEEDHRQRTTDHEPRTASDCDAIDCVAIDCVLTIDSQILERYITSKHAWTPTRMRVRTHALPTHASANEKL